MDKKVIICTIVILTIGVTGAYANPEDTPAQDTSIEAEEVIEVEAEVLSIADTLKDAGEGIQVINPKKNVTVSKKTMLLELTGAQNTEITIEIYYNASLEVNKKNYVALGEPITLVIGDTTKRNWAEVELKKGSNKIVFTATYEDDSTETLVRYVDVKNLEEVQKELSEGNLSDSNSVIKSITGRN